MWMELEGLWVNMHVILYVKYATVDDRWTAIVYLADQKTITVTREDQVTAVSNYIRDRVWSS